VQLSGEHIDSSVNNPAENVGQWKGKDAAASSRTPAGRVR
jgi:hypothetical protein